MDENNKVEITSEDLRKAFEGESAKKEGDKKPSKIKKPSGGKKYKIFTIVGAVGLVAGVACLLVAFFGLKGNPVALDFPVIPAKEKEMQYSLLTGQPLAEGAQQNAPTYCIQTPNGLDGARPQVGLTEAGVVFEAIAEAGITRFAAIYQDPSSAIIGPVRSLRIYYLKWDIPFNCTIVHAGGATDAIEAVAAGGYRDLSEDYQYMYRGTYKNRLWNNLFTTSNYLKQFNIDHGYNTSEIKGFARLTPKESGLQRASEAESDGLKITAETTDNTSELKASVPSITLNMGGSENFNVSYNYNPANNTYLRNYAGQTPHEVYSCPNEDLGEKDPENVCSLTQLAPSVVVAMIVNEGRAADGYHEDITVVGSGDVYIFQNGTVLTGTWKKSTEQDQIQFLDKDGEQIKLAPGQTFVTAVPKYGSVVF